MIKINYDTNTGEILGRYPDDIDYKAIPDPYIEVENCRYDDSQKINLQTLTLEEKAAEVTEEEEEEEEETSEE